jgi:hypothetical protein
MKNVGLHLQREGTYKESESPDSMDKVNYARRNHRRSKENARCRYERIRPDPLVPDPLVQANFLNVEKSPILLEKVGL